MYRTLSAEAAMRVVEGWADLKGRLKDATRREAALAEARRLRDQVIAEELPKFDRKFEAWVNA
jgi:hypothetical protein